MDATSRARIREPFRDACMAIVPRHDPHAGAHGFRRLYVAAVCTLTGAAYEFTGRVEVLARVADVIGGPSLVDAVLQELSDAIGPACGEDAALLRAHLAETEQAIRVRYHLAVPTANVPPCSA